jgi:hypothetical protein
LTKLKKWGGGFFKGIEGAVLNLAQDLLVAPY